MMSFLDVQKGQLTFSSRHKDIQLGQEIHFEMKRCRSDIRVHSVSNNLVLDSITQLCCLRLALCDLRELSVRKDGDIS